MALTARTTNGFEYKQNKLNGIVDNPVKYE